MLLKTSQRSLVKNMKIIIKTELSKDGNPLQFDEKIHTK